MLVILHFYAVYFVFAVLVLNLPDLLLLTVAAFAIVGGAMAYVLVGTVAPGLFDPYPASLGDPMGQVLPELLLSGAYPVAIWSAPLLVGMWIGRRNLGSARTAGRLFGIGAAVVVAASLLAPEPAGVSGLAELLGAEPHSQMPLWMLGSIGSGCAMLGAALLLVAWLPRATRPLVAVGQMALTVYVGHLMLLYAAPGLVRRETVPDAFVSVGVFAALVGLACVLWRAVFSRGPLEAAVGTSGWIVEKFPLARKSADGDRETQDRKDRAPTMAARTAHDGEKGNPL